MNPAVMHRTVPLIDLASEYRSLKSEIDAAVSRVLSTGAYILGAEGQAFEKELAAFCGVAHAVGLNSGTDAIELALRAINLQPGDEVILPVMTFIATAEPVVRLGAKVVFADIEPGNWGLDPADVARRLTSRTKAIITVHLYGQPASVQPLRNLAKKAGAVLIEDMAQALGASVEGRSVGQFGEMACVSFFPTKNLGAAGDAGAVLTNSADFDERIRRLRNHGAKVKYVHEEMGYNSRLDELQAAILRVKLKHLKAWTDRRREIAQEYTRELSGLDLELPREQSDRRHCYHLYSMLTSRREALRAHLEMAGVATAQHYATPLHLQPVFRTQGAKAGDFPVGERLARETISLPLFPGLAVDDIRYVCQSVRSFFREA